MKRGAGILLGALATTGALAACTGTSCNGAGYVCALRIDLEHDAWEPGSYGFRFSLDGVHARCDVVLFADEASSPEVTCSDPALAALGPWGSWDFENGAPAALYASGSPREAHVIVEREGVEIASGTFHPRYEVTEPNGEGCGACENATEQLSF